MTREEDYMVHTEHAVNHAKRLSTDAEPSALAGLLARVEAARGPDRELDGQLEVAARRIEAYRAGLSDEQRAKWESDAHGWVGDPHTVYEAAPVTASLDAAVALVERVLPRVWWNVGVASETHACYSADLSTGHEAPGATPALALLTALLRALSPPSKIAGEG